MNAAMIAIIVTCMPIATIQLVHSPVLATMDTLETGNFAQVLKIINRA